MWAESLVNGGFSQQKVGVVDSVSKSWHRHGLNQVSLKMYFICFKTNKIHVFF